MKNVLARSVVEWHIYPMRVKRLRVWSSLISVGLVTITLGACGTQPATPVVPPGHPVTADPGVVQSLQRQLREREQRIAELESQLDALKIIDQDRRNRGTFSRPPAMMTPVE